MPEKIRLDAALAVLGLAPSREKAKSFIIDGLVFVNDIQVKKPSFSVSTNEKIEVKGNILPFVSRGGLKLEKAINVFSIKLNDLICADIGASTGGFTDCMLQNGAKKVYAIDVGSDQLAPKLKNDKRVVNLEKTNFRYVTKQNVPEELDFASADVSFISLKLIIPVLNTLLKSDGTAVCLIKPQFEAGRENIGKNGVVKDKNIHTQVLNNTVSAFLLGGFSVLNIDYSPIKGPEGNIEYLCYIKKSNNPKFIPNIRLEDIVEMSHKDLKR